jgi:hypothetical protein
MDPSLRLLLALHLAAEDRQEDALRQGLRDAAMLLPDREGERVARALYQTLDANGRGWLARVAGR